MIDGGIDQFRLHVLDLLREKLAPIEPTDQMYAGLAREIENSVLNVMHSPGFAHDGYPEKFLSKVRIDDWGAWGVWYTVTATALDGGDVDATVELIGMYQPGVDRMIPFPPASL